MSTIAARAHSGVSLSAPVRRPAQPSSRKPGWLGRLGRVALRKPGRALVMLLFVAISAAILANALFFQKARHPAPMISAPTTSLAPRQAVRSESPVSQPATAPAALVPPSAAPMPPSRPTELTQPAREAQPREAAPRPPAAVTSVARTAPVAAPAPAPRAVATPRDPIADLINGAVIRPPGEIRSAAQARPAQPRRGAEN